MRRSILALTGVAAAAFAVPAGAQSPGTTVWPAPPGQGPATVWPDPPTAAPQQQAPRTQTPPRAQTTPRPAAPQPAPRAAQPAHSDPAAAPPARKPRVVAKPREPARTVACTGPFARNAAHADLEKSFGAANVTFTEVPGPGASKINASVVFPDDPKKRLEVIWHDEAQRTRPSAIVITAVSQWSAPSGMRLGLPLTDVEKRNGKPFMLSGFGADYGGSVSDWQGGKLDQLGGACRMGMRFSEDSGTSAEARARVQGEQVFPSNDPGIRGVKPRVSEIIIGYPQ